MIRRGTAISSAIVLWSCLVLNGGWGSPASAQPRYKEVEVRDGGTIRGSVRLTGSIPRKHLEFEITKDTDICGRRKASPRLVLGKDNGVRNAVVYIDRIQQGKKKPAASATLVLNQKLCMYEPHVMILPWGSPLEIVNSDAVLHNVHAYDLTSGTHSVFNIAQPIKGQKTIVKPSQFKSPGFVLTTCDAGHPWMSGYIVVAEHPYYAVSDNNGNFELDNVPPGTYTLTMWHEGVAITKTVMEHGIPKTYAYEDPYVESQEVVVPARETVVSNFLFTLRPATAQ